VNDAVAGLRAGRVVAAATESFFGLLADASSQEALDVLATIKPRSAGMALVIPDRSAWEPLVTSLPSLAHRLADAFWPGPLTIALPAAAGVDPRLVVDGTVGVRLPGPCPARDVCEALGGALTATSANPHGQPPPTRAEAVRSAFPSAIADGRLFVLDGECPGGLPSTVVVVHAATLVVAREGAVPRADIEAAVRRAL
jgi:L-threonylcarbamoyladenylate synthase